MPTQFSGNGHQRGPWEEAVPCWNVNVFVDVVDDGFYCWACDKDWLAKRDQIVSAF